MSHHTSNSLKAYCCDRTIFPAGGLISLRCLPSPFSELVLLFLVFPLSLSLSLSLPLSLSFSLSLPNCFSVQQSNGLPNEIWRPAKNTPLRKPYHSVERPDGTASLGGGGGASAPSLQSPVSSPLGLGLFYLL